MGDDDLRRAAEITVERRADLLIRFGIDGGERVVKNDDRRLFCEHTGDGHALLLAAGERHAALADHGVIALREAGNVPVHAGGDGGGADLRVARAADADVLLHRAGEQERLLQHNADVLAHIARGHIGNIHAADGDSALRGRVQAAEQKQQAALAGAGAAENAEALPGGHGEADVLEHVRTVLAVAEADVFKGDVPVHRRFGGVGRVLLDRGFENLAETVDGDARLAHFGDDAPKTAHRADEHRVIERERHELARRQVAVHARDGAEHDHKQDLQAARKVAHRPEVGERAGKADPALGIFVVLRLEPVALKLFAPERTHDAHAREVFLRDRGENALVLVALGKPRADLVVEEHRIEHDDRRNDPRDNGELRVHHRHKRQRKDNAHDDLENGDELLLKKHFDAFHVACAALDDVAGRMLGVPLPRQAFDVVEELIARSLDERFARSGVEHIRAVAQQRRGKTRERENERYEPHVRAQILRAAERRHPSERPGGQIHGLGVDHRVHRYADDLRRDHFDHREQQPQKDAHGEVFSAAFQQRAEHTYRASGLLFLFQFCLPLKKSLSGSEMKEWGGSSADN